MNSKEAKRILNSLIFEGDKQSIIEKLASTPERYLGDFRPTSPRAKLIQNLLQSHEIRFGDAVENLLRQILADYGFTNLDRDLETDNHRSLSLDQYFTQDGAFYLVEQKIRDDHDSTKKHGQIANFRAKLDCLFQRHKDTLTGIMYFVDPAFSKNKLFYQGEVDALKEAYPIDLHLFYGQDLFSFLRIPLVWNDLLNWVREWKTSLDDFPDIDFDVSPRESIEEIKSIRPHYWKKLIGNERIWEDGIIHVLFSDGTTLRLLFGFFSQQPSSEYQKLAESLLERINIYY